MQVFVVSQTYHARARRIFIPDVVMAVGFVDNLTVAHSAVHQCAEGELRIESCSRHTPEIAVLSADWLLSGFLHTRVGVDKLLCRPYPLVCLLGFDTVVGVCQIYCHVVDVQREVGNADTVVDHTWSYLLARNQIVGIVLSVNGECLGCFGCFSRCHRQGAHGNSQS